MSLIFGIASRAGAPIAAEWLVAAKHAVEAWPADRSQTIDEPRLAAFCKQMDTTPWAVRSQPIVADDAATVLFDGRLDNRAELADKFGLDSVEVMSDAQLVLASWHRFGQQLAEHLIGDFAIAILDHDSGDLVLVRDHLGVRPLFVIRNEDYVAFSSAMPPLLALPFCDTRWNLEWMVDYLEEVKPDAEYTAYRGISAVPPAHVVRFGRSAEERHRFWSFPVDAELLDIDLDQAISKAGELFERAVADRLVTGRGRIGCELSGGLDSSSIAAVAADQLSRRDERLIGVTQSTQEDFQRRYAMLSEGHFADAVYARYPQIERLNVDNRTDNVLDMLTGTIARHGVPPRNDFNGLASEAPDLLADRGARVLLSGFGGDQMVTANAGALAESLVAEGDWLSTFRLLASGSGRKRTLATIMRQVPILRALVPARKSARRTTPYLASEKARKAAGYPARADLHSWPAWAGTFRQRDAHNLARPVMAYRLQDSQVGAGARGVEYRYPMLDVRLIEFVHRLPAAYRNSAGEPRRLIRLLMRGRLPEKVRQRRDKFGMTVPGVFVNVLQHSLALRDHIAAMARDPVLTDYADYDEVLAALDATLAHGEFPKMETIKGGNPHYRRADHGQVLRVALLGLWYQQGTGEPADLAIPPATANSRSLR